MSKIIKSKRASKKVVGKGLLNYLIDNLPFEAHLPGGYRFAGPGTDLKTRLARGDVPLDLTDSYARDHDLVYSQTSDPKERNKADLILADKAWERVKSKDASLRERLAAYAVMTGMKLKSKLGQGVQRKKRNEPVAGHSVKNIQLVSRKLKKKKIKPKGGAGMEPLMKRVALKKPKSKKIPLKGKGLYLRPYEPIEI